MPEYIALHLMPLLVHALTMQAPRMKLIGLPVYRDTGLQALEERQADLIVGLFPEAKKNCSDVLLYEETFAAASLSPLRKRRSLDDYLARRHLNISLAGRLDGRVDKALAVIQGKRDIAVTLSGYLLGLHMAATTDLVMTEPSRFIRSFAQEMGLKIVRPPFAIPSFPVRMIWPRRLDGDAGHRWLRDLIFKLSK